MLKLENITGGYFKNNPILKGIDLTVAENEVVAIVGQNGAGKSTQEIVNSGINFFLQGGRIFPHLTVEENLAFAGMGLSKKSFRLRKEEVMSYFDLFKNAGNGRKNCFGFAR